MNLYVFKGITVATLETQEPFFLVLVRQKALILPQNPVAIVSDHPVTEIPEKTGNPEAYSGNAPVAREFLSDAKSGRAALINPSPIKKIHGIHAWRRDPMIG